MGAGTGLRCPAHDAGVGTGLLIALPALRERKHPYCEATGIRQKGAAGLMAGSGAR